MARLTLTAPSRIHMGLIDLGRVTARTFGGLGFMVEEPLTKIIAQSSDETEVIFSTNVEASSRTYLQARLHRLLHEVPGPAVRVEVAQTAPEHVGLGSKTMMTLAALTAVAEATGRSVEASAIQRRSGRGGASGVGIHGFYKGGFIVDSGRLGAFPLLPSSLQDPDVVPALTLAIPMPSDWIVTLVLPPGTRRSGQAEASFFKAVTPIARWEILEQFALIFHGIVPALQEQDLNAFGDALHAFSDLGFKAREIAEQGKTIVDTISALRNIAPCVGMSSMGPLVFVISKHSILKDMLDLPSGTTIVGETVAVATGFKVRYD